MSTIQFDPTESPAVGRDQKEEEMLLARTKAEACAPIDVNAQANLSSDQWKLQTGGLSSMKRGGFQVFTRSQERARTHNNWEVMATGELQGTLPEAAALLHSPDNEAFRVVMAQVYGRAFQSSQMVHKFAAVTPLKHQQPLPAYQCVRSVSFSRPTLSPFARDERWCFLEQFAPLNNDAATPRRGFTISQRSLDPTRLPPYNNSLSKGPTQSRYSASTASGANTHQLLNVSLTWSVEVIDENHPEILRVVFYGQAGDGRSALDPVAQRRLLLLARGMCKLPSILRRRRSSLHSHSHSLESHRASTTARSGRAISPSSPRCVCCWRSLHALLRVKKSRCYLCAQLVCSRCWVRQPLETATGRRVSILMCSHCLEDVAHDDLAQLAAVPSSPHQSTGSSSSNSSASTLIDSSSSASGV